MMLPPPPVSIHALPPPPRTYELPPAPTATEIAEATGLLTETGRRSKQKYRPIPEQLLRELGYDPETGRLYWLYASYRRTGREAAGSTAGYPSHGRMVIHYMYTMYIVSRVIWTKVYGPIPNGLQIDHRDLDPMNNRLGNLRLATNSLNGANKGKARNKTSQYKGVSWDKERGKWFAKCEVNGRQMALGRFDDEYAAHLAYVAATTRAFGNFARSVGTSHLPSRAKPAA